MATRSIPIVSCRPSAKASLSFVPTPSVPLTSKGSSMSAGSAHRPAKPPTSATTSGMRVLFASGLMRSTSSSPESMSTPASRYVMAIAASHTREETPGPPPQPRVRDDRRPDFAPRPARPPKYGAMGGAWRRGAAAQGTMPAPVRMKLGRLLRLATALALCLLLVFLVFEWTGASRLMEPNALHAGGPLAAVLGVALLVVDVVLPVPSSVIMLAHGAWFGALGGALLSVTGGALATLTAILLGRVARGFVERMISEEERALATRLVDRWGMAAIAATRPIPILAETVAI